MEDEHKINRQTGQGTMNQCNSPTLRDILSLQHSQPFAEPFLNTIPSCHGVKRSPQWHPQVSKKVPTLQPSSQAKSSTLSTLPIKISSLFSKLTFKPEITSNHINNQHKKSHLLLPRLTKNQSVISKQQVRDLNPFPTSPLHLIHR